MLNLEVKPHRRAVMARSSVGQKLFVLLRLQAGRYGEEPAGSCPVALALAVDTSGSMYAHLPGGTAKIERAIEAIGSIATLPEVGSRVDIALIHFDHRAATLLPMGPLSADGGNRLAEQAARLRSFGGGTNLAKALEMVQAEMSGVEPSTAKKAVILTDGETTDEPRCLALADQLAERNIALICIGLGVDYNEDFLASLADRTNGFQVHLSESQISLEALRQSLSDVISQATEEFASDLRLALRLAPAVTLNWISRVYPMVQTLPPHAQGVWPLGSIRTGGEVDLVLELDLPDAAAGKQILGEVRVVSPIVPPAITTTELSRAIEVAYTDDEALAGQLDEEVVFFVRQMRISSLANQAVQHTLRGRMQDAYCSIQAIDRLSREVGNEAMAKVIQAAQRELAHSAALGSETIKAMKVGAKTKTLCAWPTRQGH